MAVGVHALLLTMAPPQPTTDAKKVHEALEKAGYRIFKTMSRPTKAFKDPAAQGVPVNLVTGNALAKAGLQERDE